MKLILCSISMLLGMLCSISFGQGENCLNADPFCTDNNYTFPASVDTDAQSGPDYGCLSSQPNPAWYYIQIAQSGNLVIDLGSTNGVDDIDFICWGPFNNLATACNGLTGGGFFDFCTLFGTYPCGNIVDCSYSMDATEVCTINNAVAGQYYMFLITNFENEPTEIFANTNLANSTAATNCNIVPPVETDCIINSFTANISACAPNNTFSVTGDFFYTDNPGSGTLIVEVDNGTSTFTQTFNPPFVDGQTYNYSISNIPADGASSSVTVYFSADPACTQTITYSAVSDCSCSANIGTFTENFSGQSGTQHVLCYGDQLTITPNGDYDQADEASNPPGPAYDPGIGWLVYSCPPTIGIVPSTTEDLVDDPCLIGVSYFGPFSETNNLSWITDNPGVFTDNIVYFVPLTFYSMSSLTYSYVNTSMPCFDMGNYYAIQYLPEVTFNVTSDCATGQATATVSGGSPAIDGSLFTAVAGSLTPPTANFVNTTCTNGGTIVVGGLSSGDSYSFDVSDPNGCTVTISGVVTGGGGAAMTYPQTNYCQDMANPSPTVSGSSSGSFSAPAGCVINPATGVIDLEASTPGNYTVGYTGTGGACPPSASFNISIHALPTVVAGPDQSVCSGGSVTLSGSGASTYVWNNGVVNGVPFSPSSTATYTVTGTSAAGCVGQDQVTITVDPVPSPQFSANITSGCSPLTVTFTNLSGGQNCTWDFGDGSAPATGCNSITHTYTAVGCFDVALTTVLANGCQGNASMDNYICVLPNPIASFVPNPTILTTIESTSQMVNSSVNALTYHWDFGDGTTSTANQPLHTFPHDEGGSYSVQLIAYANGCTDTAYATVVVQDDLIYYVPNTFTPDGDEFNQTFQPVFTTGFDPYDFNMLIFDRWGEVIFETNNDKIGWDGTYLGKLVKEGTYTWKIEFKTSASDARKMEVGHVNVIR